MHELRQPLVEYFSTPQGLVLLDDLIEDDHLNNLLTPFLDGENVAQEPHYVKELIRVILIKIEMNLEKYTSTQVIDMTSILRPYGVCDHLEVLVQFQKGIPAEDDYSIKQCMTTDLPLPADFFIMIDGIDDDPVVKRHEMLKPNDIIEYNRQNRSICIDCIDRYFDELEQLSHDRLIVEFTQSDIGQTIAERGNIYTLYRYFEILKTFSISELNMVLTLKNKDEKTIGYYLLESRHDTSASEELMVEYILKTYINLLHHVHPIVRSMILTFESYTQFTLSNRIMHRCENDAETLCAYLVLLGNDATLVHGEIHPLSQQLVFEYIKNMIDSPEKNTLIDLALSADSALHAFIIYVPDGRTNSFLMYSKFQHLQPYIGAFLELKNLTEQQSHSLISTSRRFFLPAPLNAIKSDRSEFYFEM